jgi:uncharacterized membrane protein
MPYTSVDKCVYKKNEDGKRGEKVGCTKGAIKDYLAALYASDKNEAKLAHQQIKEALQDNVDPTTAALNIDDQLGTFFIVQKPTKDATVENIVCEGDLFTIANLFKRGLDFDNVFGLYKTAEKAQRVGESLIKEMRNQMRENLKAGDVKVSEIEQDIQDTKMEIEHHMQSAMTEPGTRDARFADAERLLGDLKQKEAMLAKLKGALETEVKKLDEAEKVKTKK